MPSEERKPLYFECHDPPYQNYFYADHTVACQAVLASPLPKTEQNTLSRHRLLFAWPAGNSGAVVFFRASKTGQSGQQIWLKPGTAGRHLDAVHYEAGNDSNSRPPSVGVSCLIEFTEASTVDIAVLGSIRTIRDYTEGDSLLNPVVQSQLRIGSIGAEQNGVKFGRLCFDQQTIFTVTFVPAQSLLGSPGNVSFTEAGSVKTVHFATGFYTCEAHVNYPPVICLQPQSLLKTSFQDLVSSSLNAVQSLSFLCTTDKILAGAWRFLTYFGRDSMISLLLLRPILNTAKQGPVEIGLKAALERIDYKTGSVCHEENIGDYVAAQAALTGGSAHEPEFDYKMIDTDFFLPLILNQHFQDDSVGKEWLLPFLKIRASVVKENAGKTYGELLARTCEKIIISAQPLSQGAASYKDLIALKHDQPVGQWRDSNDGLGGGRYPYDVNTALMPAALRAISSLASAGVFEDKVDWTDLALELAEVWETSPLKYFEVNISRDEAQKRVEDYASSRVFDGPSLSNQIHNDLSFQAIALREDGSPVEIMHTDDCFRFFLLSHLIYSPIPGTATEHLKVLDRFSASILRTFPFGLYTSVGILIANPAFSADRQHHQAFSTGAYHGPVVWSWNSLAMTVKGLELQLIAERNARDSGLDAITKKIVDSQFYQRVMAQTKQAYAKVWNVIEANREYLSAELWSWRWDKEGGEMGQGDFQYMPLSHLPTPYGQEQTESNIRQTWSLTFLALKRYPDLEL